MYDIHDLLKEHKVIKADLDHLYYEMAEQTKSIEAGKGYLLNRFSRTACNTVRDLDCSRVMLEQLALYVARKEEKEKAIATKLDAINTLLNT